MSELNAGFVFGPLDRSTAVTFPDSLYVYGTKIKTETYVQDLLFDYGLLYARLI